jgi:hypothetical protein
MYYPEIINNIITSLVQASGDSANISVAIFGDIIFERGFGQLQQYIDIAVRFVSACGSDRNRRASCG